jgi:hypothetical protein
MTLKICWIRQGGKKERKKHAIRNRRIAKHASPILAYICDSILDLSLLSEKIKSSLLFN